MNRYNNGKIYKLVNSVDSEIYIGSTCKPLAKRKYEHKRYSKHKADRKVYQHLNRVGWKNVRIILIESVQVQTKDQLLAREQYYIDLLIPSLNKNSAVADCPHGRKKCQCRDCGGSSICIHNKRKSNCKDCGGSQICEHARQKNNCKDCGGASICDHNKRKQQCKDCNGNKYYCYECKKSYTSQANLTRHSNSKTHKQTYIRMFKEVFNEDITESEVPIY